MPTDPTDTDRFRNLYAELVADGPGQVPGEDAVSAAILLMEYQDATQLMTNAVDGLEEGEGSNNPGEIRKRIHIRGRDWTLIVPVDADNFLDESDSNDDNDDGEREDDNCA